MTLKPKRKEGGKPLGLGRLEDLLSVFTGVTEAAHK